MAEQPRPGPEPGDITGEAFRRLQDGEPPQDPDFEGAIRVFHGEEPKPGVTAADALGGPEADQVEETLRLAEARAGRGIQRRISGIFEKATGGVKLGAKEAFRLTGAIVSRAANTKVFGQPLTSSLDYALHHKKELVVDAVAGAVGGGVAGGLGKTIARAALAGTGGLLAAAAIGAVGGAAAGGVTEYLRQRKKIDIDKAEGALIVAGLRNEFRRFKEADKNRIRNAALRGAFTGAVAGVIGAEFADNPWVQEQIAKIRLPEIKLPEIKLPEVKLPSVLPPSVPAGVTAVPATPTVEPTATVEAPVAASTAVPTAEATATPTARPTSSPTGTPIPTETPTPVPTAEATATPVGVAPRATPPPVSLDELSPPAAPAQELTPAQFPATPEPKMPAAPPAPPVTTEPAIGKPTAILPTEPLALVEPAPAGLPISAELPAVPEQIPLPAGSNPWEETGHTLRNVLGRDPTNAEILQVTKEVCRQSGISVPNWEIAGKIDHRALPINYKLIFNDPVKNLIAGIKR